MKRILRTLVVSCLMGFSDGGPASAQSAIRSEAEVVSPSPETQSAFLKDYSPAVAIKRYSVEGSGAQESAPGGGNAGRNCAFYEKQFVSWFVIRSGNEAPLMADVEREIKSSLAQQDGRIVKQSGRAPSSFRIDYASGKSKGTVIVDPVVAVDPTTVGGPGGIDPSQTAVKLHIRITETWYKTSQRSCKRL